MELSWYWIKRILGQSLMPLGVSLALCLWGGILGLVGRPKRALAPCVLAAMLLYAASLDPVAAWIVAPLERACAPLSSDDPRISTVRWIVVLGSSHHRERLPALARLDTVAVARLAEAVRLMRRIPGARLLLTGGSPTAGTPHAQVVSDAAQALGVEPSRMVVEAESLDTPQQMALVARIVGNDPWIVVTSATHMPRAVLLARGKGLSPLPAPTAFETFSPEGLPFLPYATNVLACHRALHEYLGIAWAWMGGAISLRHVMELWGMAP